MSRQGDLMARSVSRLLLIEGRAKRLAAYRLDENR